jgi:DNA-binding NtrC family response regulator
VGKPPGFQAMHRILILYPDPSFRKKLWLALVKMGYDVVEAANTSEAKTLHRHLPADMLITDLRGCRDCEIAGLRSLHRHHPILRIVQFTPGFMARRDPACLMRELIGSLRDLVPAGLGMRTS